MVHDAPAAVPRCLPPFYFLATYWGERFEDWLCRFAIASLLAPRNIPVVKNLEAARFLVCTTKEDWARLQNNLWFQKLKQLLQVELIENPESVSGEHKYVRMSRGHALLAERCFRDGAIAININPDSIYPDGCIEEAQYLAENGRRVILCGAIRFDLEGVQVELRKRGLISLGAPLQISRREATEVGLRNLHAETQASRWGARNFGALAPEHQREHFLTCCYWVVPDQSGVIIVTHNWSPFLVDYTMLDDHDSSALDGRALDGVYIFENFGHGRVGEEIHIVIDSDSIFLLGMTPSDEMVPPKSEHWWKSAYGIGYFTKGYILNQTVFDPGIDDVRRKLYSTQVSWHARPKTKEWDRVHRQAARILDSFARVNLDLLTVASQVGWTAAARVFFTSPYAAIVSIGRVLLSPLYLVSRLISMLFRYSLFLKTLDAWFYIERRLIFVRRIPLYARAIARALAGDQNARDAIRRRVRYGGRKF